APMSLRFVTTPLVELDDDVLVVRAQGGDCQAQTVLLERYRRLVRAKGRGFFLVGGDAEDVQQEALIGLYKAIRDYQVDRQASFRAFAELCITRQIITAIKTATRQKHQPLNRYVSISAGRPDDEGGERTVEDLIDVRAVTDPADLVVSYERVDSMRAAMADMLSGLEVEVLQLYVDGKSYQEISEMLGRHVKSVDNALQRIKRKLDQHLQDEEELERCC
ncbi:MAG TPA: RNA polymerase sporulation sigma factor SigH, partial [Acidimicrobiales bacterium]